MRGLRFALAVVTGLSIVTLAAPAGAGILTYTPTGPIVFGLVPVVGPPVTRVITLNNASTATEVTGFTPGAGCGEFTVTASGLPVTMAAGASLPVTVSYDPVDRTADSCTFTIANDSGGAAETIPMTGDGEAAQLALTPPMRDFGPSRINTSGALPNQIFTITNSGEIAASVSAAMMVGTQDFSVPAGPITANPGGGTASFTVTYDAVTVGAKADTVLFTAASVPSLSAMVTGTGTASDQQFPSDPFTLGSVAVGGSITTPVGIINAAGASATLTITSLSLDDNQFAFTDHNCTGQTCSPTPSSIAIGATDPYNIRCTPSGGGLQTATLTVVSNDPTDGVSTSKSITLRCTGAPTIVTSTLAGFGSRRVGTTSAIQNLTISNPAGAAPFMFTATVTGDYGLSCSGGGGACFTNRVVAGGASTVVQVQFTPTGTGLRNGNLTIIAAAAANSPTVVVLTGTGIQPTLGVDGSLAFGNVPVLLVGGATQQLQLRNTGTDTLSIPSLAITGTTDISFASPCTAGQTCTTPISIPALGNTNITLRCDPSATGPRNGTLTITSDSNSPNPTTSTAVALTCNGTQPNVMVAPTSLSFGPQRVGTGSTAQQFTITNPTGANVGATSYAVTSGSGELGISCAPSCTGTLNPGAVVTVSVVFTPSALMARVGTITVSTPEDMTALRTVTVTGTGVQPTIFLLTPSTLTFPDTQVGQTSAPQTIQIRNTGSQDLLITQVTNSNPTDFDLTGATTGTVASTGTQQWSVTCSPDALGTGTKTGTITIVNDSANDTSLDVQLTCSTIQGRLVLTAAPIVYATATNTIDFGRVRTGQASATTVTLTNVGNRAVTLTGAPAVSFSPDTQGFTATAPSALTIAPSGTSTFLLTFAPTLPTQGTAVMNIPTDWNSFAVTVTGDGQDTSISVMPNPHNYGDVLFSEDKPQLFTITNLGEGTFNVMSATLVNPGADFALSGFSAGLVAQNGTKTFTVTATPNDTLIGDKSTTLLIVTDLDGAGGMVMVPLTYRSTGAGIAINPDTTIDFGGVDVDLAGGASRTVAVMNTGTAPMTITGVTTPGGAFTRSDLPATIAPGATSNITVTFLPTTEADAATQDTQSFDIVTAGLFTTTGAPSAPSQRITLRGYGIDRHIHVRGDDDTLVLDFGQVYRNPTATDLRAIKQLQVCNSGEAILAVSMVTDPAAPYEVTSAPSFTVGPRASATQETCSDVTVEFRPAAYGMYDNFMLTVMNDDMVPMTTVVLNGTGIARPVTITPGSAAARVAVGVPVRLKDIIASGLQASNPSNEAFTVEVRLTDATNSSSIVGTLPTSIAAGETQQYDLEFVAKAAGPFTVTADIYLDGDPDSHQTVQIALVGVAVDVGGGVGCSAGRGSASWWLLALGAFGLVGLRRRRSGSAAAALLVVAGVAGATSTAQAQVSREIEIGTFHVTPSTESAMFTIETPQIAMKGAWALGLSVNYAVDVLTANDGMNLTSLVGGRTQLELGFGYAVLDRLEVGARVPIFRQSGDAGSAGADKIYGLEGASGNALGDVAINAKLSLTQTPTLGLALAVEGTIPTGKDGQFAGARTPTGRAGLVLGLAVGKRVGLAVNAAFLGRGAAEFSNLKQGNAATYGAGASFRALEKLWVIGEVFGEVGLTDGDRASARPLEADLGLRYRIARSTSIAMGGGRGLMNGVGAPMVRGFVMLTVSPQQREDVELHPYVPPPPRDTGDDDGDGVVNADDACKLDAEDKDGFEDSDGCPEADNDGDGVLDADDKCPTEPEDKDGFEDGDGCIDADNDGDGIPDIDDKCPAEPEDKDGFEDGDGCEEPDNDKDGVPDVLDQCAMEPETINGNADEDGCPDQGDSMVMVMPDRIEVLEPLTFQGVTSKLNKNAGKTLSQIGATMRADRKIKRVRITVHVQPRNGGDQALSDKRADEIRAWLVNWGVEPERLDAKGIGSKRPLVPRNTKGAAEINDRVEFIIFERN